MEFKSILFNSLLFVDLKKKLFFKQNKTNTHIYRRIAEIVQSKLNSFAWKVMQKIKLQTKPIATTDQPTTDRLTTFRLDPGEVNKGGGGSGDDRSHQYKLALNRFSQLPVRAGAEKRNSSQKSSWRFPFLIL